jgi:large subunit ribosomal protein L31e
MSESESKEESVASAATEEEVESAEETITEEETAQPEEEKPVETEPAEEEEGEAAKEEIEVVEERIYTVPLRHTWVVTARGKRAPRAARDVRAFVARHMKAEEVAVSDEVNAALWKRGINKPPRKIKIRAVKDKEGKVIIYPAKAA